jgi:23S rRNA pseudouridine1911/1915/1917 synthase
MAVVQIEGKTAITHYLTVATHAASGAARVHCALETGRTHQIRVHLAHLRAPLLADTLYGAAPSLYIGRQALHAARLSFEHPKSKKPVHFIAPIAADMRAAAQALGMLDPNEPV